MSQHLILVDAVASAYREKKMIGGFFRKLRHSLLAVMHGIFTGLRCN
jgi:hypothetical protein